MPRFNKCSSLGAESMTTTPASSVPGPHTRSSVAPGFRGREDITHVTQDMDLQSEAGLGPEEKTALEEYDNDDVSIDHAYGSGSRRKSSKGSGVPSSGSLHPGAILAKHKPSLRRLEDLPGLSIVTWEEFLENPSVLCGLFQVDRDEFIHYNAEQVNVFFHDSRMEQPTLGAPSGDGLSWTIFIDNYNHLKMVRSCLTERVSVLLLHLVRAKGAGLACLVAVNPARKAVEGRLQDSFSRAVDAFLQQRNFCLEIDLSDCVQTWCRTDLKMPCKVSGGRVVITNAEERIPCSRVESVPFCVACFPVWGIRKLSYKYKRQSEYEDIVLTFAAEDLSLGNKSRGLEGNAEHGPIKANARAAATGAVRTPAEQEKSQKTQQGWLRKKHSATTTTTTPASTDKADIRGHLEIQEVDSADDGQERKRGPKRFNSKQDKERGQDSGFSSDNTSTAERCEPQLSKGIPSYRPHSYVPPRPSDKTRRVSRNQHNMDDASSTSASTSYASSVLSPSHGKFSGSRHRTPREGASDPAPISWQVVEDVEVEEDRDGGDIMSSPATLGVGQDPRAADFGQTLAFVQSDDDEEEGDYALLEESRTPSPRPDTPYHKPLASTSMRGNRPGVMMTQGAVITEERVDGGERISYGDRAQHSGSLASSLPADFRLPKEQYSSRRRHDSSVRQPSDEGGLYGTDNGAFEYDDSYHDTSKQLRSIQVVQNPVSVLKENGEGSKAFPYTSDYLDAIGTGRKLSPRYGLVDQNSARGDELKKNKKAASALGKDPADMLFAPRDHNQYKHNMHNDDDADEVEDVEDDVGVISDEEEMRSTRTDELNSLKPNRANVRRENTYNSGDFEDAETAGMPGILAGAKGAQHLRSSKEFPIQGANGDVWRRGGQQNDSRRRYIALNSLRRKANQQALQADLRKAKQSETPSSAPELLEF